MNIRLNQILRIQHGDCFYTILPNQDTDIPDALAEYVKKQYPNYVVGAGTTETLATPAAPTAPAPTPPDIPSIPIERASGTPSSQPPAPPPATFQDLFSKCFQIKELEPPNDIIKKAIDLGVIKKTPEGYSFEGVIVHDPSKLDPKDVCRTIDVISQ
jgi:hypothetical protein